ncbi:MAG TPA: hypothetical protein VFK38_01140 [Candidatus Limnocylindrales bacterium]|nr:hypothetical protein [Candidatus Limnocylindrales bacterium]
MRQAFSSGGTVTRAKVERPSSPRPEPDPAVLPARTRVSGGSRTGGLLVLGLAVAVAGLGLHGRLAAPPAAPAGPAALVAPPAATAPSVTTAPWVAIGERREERSAAHGPHFWADLMIDGARRHHVHLSPTGSGWSAEMAVPAPAAGSSAPQVSLYAAAEWRTRRIHLATVEPFAASAVAGPVELARGTLVLGPGSVALGSPVMPPMAATATPRPWIFRVTLDRRADQAVLRLLVEPTARRLASAPRGAPGRGCGDLDRGRIARSRAVVEACTVAAVGG